MNNTYYSRTQVFFFFHYNKLWINDLCAHSFCLVWCQIHTNTLYNILLRIARNFLETRKNFKISIHPFYRTNLDQFSREWSKKNIFFEEKKKSKWPIFQNGRFSKSPIFEIFFAKILQIGPCVSRIDWCEVL